MGVCVYYKNICHVLWIILFHFLNCFSLLFAILNVKNNYLIVIAANTVSLGIIFYNRCLSPANYRVYVEPIIEN